MHLLCYANVLWSLCWLCGGSNSSDLIHLEIDGSPCSHIRHDGSNGGKGQSTSLRRVCHHLHNVAVLYISLQPPGSIAVLHQMLPFSTSSWFTPPSCSKPAGYFCSIWLLPPTEQLTLQQLYGSGAFQNVRFVFGSSMLVWHICGTKTLKLSPCSQ